MEGTGPIPTTAAAEDPAALAARRRARRSAVLTHAALLLGVLVFAFPIWITLIGSTHDVSTIGRGDVPLLPGPHLAENYATAWAGGAGRFATTPAGLMLANSLVMAVLIAAGKIAISLLSAYAIVFFRFRFHMAAFWLIFITLMLPVEVRIIPTFEVMVSMRLTNTMAGLVVPLIASATATLLFRQFFLTIPDEYVEAAKIDGAGPMRFFRDVVLPLSVTNIAALFVILFIYGWNQYLWPLLVADEDRYRTVQIGLRALSRTELSRLNLVMAGTVIAAVPIFVLLLVFQRQLIRGLTAGAVKG